jgi:hypothetical protein
VSPTAPTFVTINNQLNKAHRRIRELEARETELVAHNRTLCALITELTPTNPPGTATELDSSSNEGSDGFAVDDQLGKHTRQRLGKPRSQTLAENPDLANASGADTTRVKTTRPHRV